MAKLFPPLFCLLFGLLIQTNGQQADPNIQGYFVKVPIAKIRNAKESRMDFYAEMRNVSVHSHHPPQTRNPHIKEIDERPGHKSMVTPPTLGQNWEGNNANDSKIHVGFSGSTDPFGSWSFYEIPASINGKWSDFPEISIGSSELFICVNQASGGQGTVSSAIWQVGKYNGYSGQASLTAKVWPIPDVSWHPVQSGDKMHGPRAYFLRNRENGNNSYTYYLRMIDAIISDCGSMSLEYSLNSTTPYSLPPPARQLGTNTQLSTNGLYIQSAYFANNKIQFAHNTGSSNGPSVMYGTIVLNQIGNSVISITSQEIILDSLEIAYPSLAFAGTSPGGYNYSLMGFNYAGLNHFPGNACVFIDESGNPSEHTFIKKGTGPMSTSISLARWGDYTATAIRYNNPGEAWFAGSYGQVAAVSKSTWISQIYAPGISSVDLQEKPQTRISLSLFPNPATEFVNLEFQVETPGAYSVQLQDFSGKPVLNFGQRELRQGSALFRFNVAPLSQGTYLVRFIKDARTLKVENLVIQR